MATTKQIREMFRARSGATRAPAPSTPQFVAPDLNYNRTALGLQRTRDRGLVDAGAAESEIQRSYGGSKIDPTTGQVVFDYGDPASRATMLQQQWQKAKADQYQNAGNNLYSSSFQQGANALQNAETTSYASLLAAKNAELTGVADKRTNLLDSYLGGLETAQNEKATALAAEPNSDTVSDRTTGFNADGSPITTGQDGTNKAGQAFILWRSKTGKAFHIYADGHRVRMKKKDKK